MNDFFRAIIQCIHSATVINTIEGTRSGVMQIYYQGGDIILPKGFGDHNNDIGTIVRGFIGKVERLCE